MIGLPYQHYGQKRLPSVWIGVQNQHTNLKLVVIVTPGDGKVNMVRAGILGDKASDILAIRPSRVVAPVVAFWDETKPGYLCPRAPGKGRFEERLTVLRASGWPGVGGQHQITSAARVVNGGRLPR
jgi:hypothetical protein